MTVMVFLTSIMYVLKCSLTLVSLRVSKHCICKNIFNDSLTGLKEAIFVVILYTSQFQCTISCAS